MGNHLTVLYHALLPSRGKLKRDRQRDRQRDRVGLQRRYWVGHNPPPSLDLTLLIPYGCPKSYIFSPDALVHDTAAPAFTAAAEQRKDGARLYCSNQYRTKCAESQAISGQKECLIERLFETTC
jgi:hypothetical protein